MVTTTDNDGYFQLGDLSYILPVGSYTVTPARFGCSFTPASTSNITIKTQTVEGLGDVPWPVTDINFQANCTITFSTSDLAGTWHGHALSSGLGNGKNGWVIYTLTSDRSGNVSVTYRESEGDSGTIGKKISVSNNGILTQAGGAVFHGVMNNSKNIIVATDTRDQGENALIVFVKGGGQFSTSDFAGTRYGHALGSGSGNEWGRIKLTATSSGAFTGKEVESNGESGTGSGKMNISNSGILSLEGEPGFSGVMSKDKSTIIGTNAGDPGEYLFEVFIKR